MAVTPYIIGYTMTGSRKESFYVEKYGVDIGRQKYQQLLKQRESRVTRRSASDNLVQCQLCKKEFKRITQTHLKYTCVENVTTKEYLKRFPTAELIPSELKTLYSNTKESIIEKYGNEVGSKKWQSYCDIQAKTNTFDYKASKFNISKEQFIDYNRNRSATLENFIKRHGEEQGVKKWYDYCDRQRYTTTLEYFIETYGVEAGTKKYQEFCVCRNMTNNVQSKIEIAAYTDLKLLMKDLEISVRLNNPYYGPYDFGNLSKKKLIEFYGTYWHADPRFFEADQFFSQKKQTASQIHARDQAKRSYATSRGFKLQVIWEHDWRKNKQQVINNLITWWNNNENR
jgi:hypothetical protein